MTKEMVSQLISHVTEYWGKKCEDFDDSCCVCQAWLAVEQSPLVLEQYIDEETDLKNKLDALREATKKVSGMISGEERRLLNQAIYHSEY